MEDNRFKSKKVLLIDGSSKQILPFMKALHELGCVVATYNSSKLDVGYTSKYANKRILAYFNPEDEEGTYKAIKEEITKKSEYDVVVPANDFTAIILSKHKEELERHAKIMVNDWEIFELASDKLKTMRICMENNIPCPYTFILENPRDIERKKLMFPLVIKPRTSHSAQGFEVIKSLNEFDERLPQIIKEYGPVVIQDYIPHAGKQYQAEMVVDKYGNLKSCVIMDKLRWYPLDGGSSTLNVTIHDEKIKEICKNLMKATKWRGYAEIDFIQDPRDNSIKVMEINPRLNRTFKICFESGVNIGKQMMCDIFDYPVPEYMNYTDNVYIRFFHMDLLWFFASKERFRSNPSFFSFRNTKDLVFSWGDLKPFLTFSIQSAFELRHKMKIKKEIKMNCK